MGIWERLALDPAVHRLVALVGAAENPPPCTPWSVRPWIWD